MLNLYACNTDGQKFQCLKDVLCVTPVEFAYIWNSNSKGDEDLFELQRDSISRKWIIRFSWVSKIDGDFEFVRIIENFE